MITLISLLVGCTSTIESANESLVGKWSINKIITSKGNRISGGLTIDTNITEAIVSIGIMEFTEEGKCTWEFKRLGKTDVGSSSYKLLGRKENEGFIKVRKYSINLNDRTFDVAFGDQTSDAHKSARDITLSYDPQIVGTYEGFVLFLKK